LKGPAVRVQYGSEEMYQRQIEDQQPIRHHDRVDRLLESLEDVNLETFSDLTGTNHIQGRVQALYPEPANPPMPDAVVSS
jgi:hypothetical protein